MPRRSLTTSGHQVKVDVSRKSSPIGVWGRGMAPLDCEKSLNKHKTWQQYMEIFYFASTLHTELLSRLQRVQRLP